MDAPAAAAAAPAAAPAAAALRPRPLDAETIACDRATLGRTDGRTGGRSVAP